MRKITWNQKRSSKISWFLSSVKTTWMFSVRIPTCFSIVTELPITFSTVDLVTTNRVCSVLLDLQRVTTSIANHDFCSIKRYYVALTIC